MTGHRPSCPIIADTELAVAKLYDMLPTAAGDSSDGRTAADNQTVRAVFVIDPDKRIRLQLTYPMSTGRNFAELLRVIDSLQLTSATRWNPADWRQGEDVIILPRSRTMRPSPSSWWMGHGEALSSQGARPVLTVGPASLTGDVLSACWTDDLNWGKRDERDFRTASKMPMSTLSSGGGIAAGNGIGRRFRCRSRHELSLTFDIDRLRSALDECLRRADFMGEMQERALPRCATQRPGQTNGRRMTCQGATGCDDRYVEEDLVPEIDFSEFNRFCWHLFRACPQRTGAPFPDRQDAGSLEGSLQLQQLAP